MVIAEDTEEENTRSKLGYNYKIAKDPLGGARRACGPICTWPRAAMILLLQFRLFNIFTGKQPTQMFSAQPPRMAASRRACRTTCSGNPPPALPLLLPSSRTSISRSAVAPGR